ncbi:serine hydrolase [Spirosoma sp. HMF4905]|uniref:Serine hydrolase n=1 Tax=Spirosoma arboris TaxID=2682092 RepID=A0A7K1S5L3_9BACT|nr:serine hydrolase [Spirosoma arboris]MVM29035.1 serine hydrolase [Spirosoma arboris]
MKKYLLLSVLGLLTGRSLPVFAQSPNLTTKVDSLFATWSKSDSPGCACGVIKDQKLIYTKGYGMADLEHDAPITSQSVFYIASTSKQFTAASIALLAIDKKLSLDDDIRTYIPEMPSYGKPIRINNLLHHTSGLRDHFDVMSLAGWYESDYVNNEMSLQLMAQQRALNFETGTKYEYSNTNYMLLAEIVRRVSGKSLRLFAQERLFAPLGMNHTHFDDDYRQVVKQRVISYDPVKGNSYVQLLKDFDLHGDGNLLTTVEDLYRWDANFYTGKVGGKELTKLLLTKGVLANGDTIPYALGLSHGKYKGLPTVSHTGGFKGFRTQLIRFPQQQFSVVVLCNLGSLNPSALANKVADIYLSSYFTQAKVEQPKQTASTKPYPFVPATFDPYVGQYELSSDFIISFKRDGDRYYSQATGQPEFEIFPTSDTTFSVKAFEASLTFHRQPDGKVNKVTLHQNGNHPANRVATVVPYSIPPEQLTQYAGTYTSAELNASYSLVVEKDTLHVRHSRLGDMGSCKPTSKDKFNWNGDKIDFVRSADGQLTGFRIAHWRIRDVWFEKR